MRRYEYNTIADFEGKEIATDLDTWNYSSSAEYYDTYNVIDGFSRTIMSGSMFKCRNNETLSSTHYYCRIKNKYFNFSNNMTWQTGSFGLMKWSDMYNDPKVYITTIGLYNDNNDLLAVAKLSKPVQKNFNNDITIKVKLDY